MFLKIFAIVCFATLVTFVYCDDADLLTLNCYSCLSFDQEPTAASCSSYMNCTDLAAGENYPVQYAICVRTKTQVYDSKTIYQASCEHQITLLDYKYCTDLETSYVPGVEILDCKSCRGNLCNSY